MIRASTLQEEEKCDLICYYSYSCKNITLYDFINSIINIYHTIDEDKIMCYNKKDVDIKLITMRIIKDRQIKEAEKKLESLKEELKNI